MVNELLWGSRGFRGPFDESAKVVQVGRFDLILHSAFVARRAIEPAKNRYISAAIAHCSQTPRSRANPRYSWAAAAL